VYFHLFVAIFTYQNYQYPIITKITGTHSTGLESAT